MLGFMVVVADLGTALVPVITAVIVFWVAGLERRYMLRVGAARRRAGGRRGRVAAATAWAASSLTSIRIIRKIEMIDTHGWIRNLRAALHQRARRRAISRANRKSRWAPAACSASA